MFPGGLVVYSTFFTLLSLLTLEIVFTSFQLQKNVKFEGRVSHLLSGAPGL